MPHLSVVVPTYNEAATIQDVLRHVVAACEGTDFEVVVVDDNSPDGTGRLVEAMGREDRRVRLVLRTHERGLATAVIEGIRRSSGTYVVVMDSDFQHPPATIPKLLEAATTQRADLVVASRYAPGGAVKGFPLSRKVISWGAKAISVVALSRVRHFHITDPMSGFFLVRRDAVDPEALRPRGYKILIEVLVRGRVERATEVGFTFDTRKGGVSKLRLKTQYDYFLHVVGLGFADRENQRLLVFAIVGMTGILVNAGLYEVAKRLLHVPNDPIALLLPAALAREASILWNFTWNDLVTFRDLRGQAHAGFLARVLRFNLVSLLSFGAYLGIFYLLVALGLHDLAALLIAILTTFLVNYRGNRRWTYERRKESPNA
ncbi:MAG TPA: glycosyltransferase family 2 protein [Candidatus Thermoplasmatota archaeon]|nr:glycosyltransferase family 2 protein [Candidatus Thermoplasmatota archaeon]